MSKDWRKIVLDRQKKHPVDISKMKDTLLFLQNCVGALVWVHQRGYTRIERHIITGFRVRLRATCRQHTGPETVIPENTYFEYYFTYWHNEFHDSCNLRLDEIFETEQAANESLNKHLDSLKGNVTPPTDREVVK